MMDTLMMVSVGVHDSVGGMDGLVQALVCEVSQDKCLVICCILTTAWK